MPGQKRPYLIGVTGTIGAGKSTVGRILEARGIPVIDTDQIVHELLRSDQTAKNAVRDRFGKDVLAIDDEGRETIDRVALGKIVFSNETAKKALEAILHPLVILDCRMKVENLSTHPIVALLVPLLFEANLENEYDEIWCIYADNQVLRERLMNRDNMNRSEVDNRLAAQLPQEEKMRRSHHIIDNSQSESKTTENVDLVLNETRKAIQLQEDR